MIKELIIKNFEPHKNFRTKLDPHITTFTGPTDIGKSSILRGIKWVVTNRPLGEKFIRDENKITFVGIRTEKGTVSRQKGKGINIYKINGKTLEIPEDACKNEIQKFLNMGELNFQFQFDAPYWFMISPGQVSKQLNQIVDLEIIDTSLAKLLSKVHTGKTEVSLSQERLDDVKKTLTQMRFMKPMMKEYIKLEDLETRKNKAHAHFDSLTIYIKKVRRYTTRVKTLGEASIDGEKLVKIGNQYKTTAFEMESLSKLIKNLEKNIAIANSEIPNIQALVSISNKWKKLKKSSTNLYRCIVQIKTEKAIVCLKEKELIETKKRLKKIIGKTCPLCGNQVTK